MRILLDTHILLWTLAGEPPLAESVQALIRNAAEVQVSVVSLWEIAIKHSLGKLALDIPLRELIPAITASGFALLPIMAEHAVTVPTLPLLHRDPFGRMLVAQSLVEPLRLLTCDTILAQYGSTILLCEAPRRST